MPLSHAGQRLEEARWALMSVQTLDVTRAAAPVLAVACLRLRGLDVVERAQWLINPETPIPEELALQTGLYDVHLAKQPTLMDSLPEIARFIGRDTIVWTHGFRQGNRVYRHFRLTHPRDRQFFLQMLAATAWPDWPRHTVPALADALSLPVPPPGRVEALAEVGSALLVHTLRHLQTARQVQTLGDLLDCCPAANAPQRRTRQDLPFDRTRLKDYPAAPGVYFMKNGRGELLYVGKAKNLRNRLRSYFQKQSALPGKVAVMMRQVAIIEATVVGSELEALLLEAALIKRHQPFFNRKVKDFQRMSFLKVSVADDFPRLSVAPEPDAPDAAYFGPFTRRAALQATVETLNRVFRLRNCNDRDFADHRASPCMQYGLGLCSAPCAGLISPEAYRESVTDFLRFLALAPCHAVDGLLARRDAYAEALRFEKAAALQSQLAWLEALQARNYRLIEAVETHHCLLILPGVGPDARRVLTVLHGQPHAWTDVRLADDLFKQADALANGALATLQAASEAAARAPIPKQWFEEVRLISQWLARHTEADGGVVFLRHLDGRLKNAGALAAELLLYLNPATFPVDEPEWLPTDEAWAWEQAQAGF